MSVVTHMRVVVTVFVAAHMIVAALVLAALALGFKSIIARCKWFLAAFKRMPQKV